MHSLEDNEITCPYPLLGLRKWVVCSFKTLSSPSLMTAPWSCRGSPGQGCVPSPVFFRVVLCVHVHAFVCVCVHRTLNRLVNLPISDTVCSCMQNCFEVHLGRFGFSVFCSSVCPLMTLEWKLALDVFCRHRRPVEEDRHTPLAQMQGARRLWEGPCWL